MAIERTNDDAVTVWTEDVEWRKRCLCHTPHGVAEAQKGKTNFDVTVTIAMLTIAAAASQRSWCGNSPRFGDVHRHDENHR